MTLSTWINSRKTLADAYIPRAPIPYVIHGLFPLPSLNIVYGAPGCLKSLLVADMVCAVAAGNDWLPGAAWETKPVTPFRTLVSRCMWVDFDNGQNRTLSRFEALGRAHGLHANAGLAFYSMPQPALNAANKKQIGELVNLIRGEAAQFVVFDNLLTISAGRDENSSEMSAVMNNLRYLAEQTGAAVVIIHHARKENGYKGGQGDNLRGFSGIRGAIDTGLFVQRESGSDSITITSEKTRDVDIAPFGASWTYTHKPGTSELETARFFGIFVSTKMSTPEIEDEVISVLDNLNHNGLSQTQLMMQVKNVFPKAGENRIRDVINKLANAGKIVASPGPRGAIIYRT